ncbi:hypothetical protein CDO23_05125 [Sinorhizobium meliloti]|nr:hypothetical protein CDO23_05125 [Sinorhizobium meliloti]
MLVTEMRAAPRLRRGEEFFQPNDLGRLDSCDEHRNEEIKKAAAGIPNLNTPWSGGDLWSGGGKSALREDPRRVAHI